MKKNKQVNSKKLNSKVNSKTNTKENSKKNQKSSGKSLKKDSKKDFNSKPKSNLRKWSHKNTPKSDIIIKDKEVIKTPISKITIPSENLIYGRHASLACMKNANRVLNHIYITQSFIDKHHEEFDAIIHEQMINENIIKVVTRNDINHTIGEDSVHNGIMCDVKPLLELDISDLIIKSKLTDNYAIAILDEAMDPHNIGAILRSASAFGIKGVLMPKRNSPTNTATLAKSASGALEVVDVIRIGNMKNTLEQLKENNFWIIGLSAGDHSTSLKDTRLDGKIAFVFGAEGKGLRDLTEKNCDTISHIPINRSMESLNLSNAAAVTFYEWYTRS